MTIDLKHKPVLFNQFKSSILLQKVNSNVSRSHTKNTLFNRLRAARSESTFGMNKLTILFFIFLSWSLSLTNVQCQESGYYYYSDGNDIQIKSDELKENSFQALIHKDFVRTFFF